ncbi:MAG: rubredoxin [Candidatus Brocadiia bacterium]
MKKWFCGTCGYVWDGENPPDKCPKCGATKDKFNLIPDDKAQLIDKSRLTNDLHMKLEAMMSKVIKLADKGIADNLDPACVLIFNQLKTDAAFAKQKIKAEIQTHISKGKWG